MQVYIADDGLRAADLTAELMIKAYHDGARTFGLATGQTMVPVYQALVDRIRAQGLDVSRDDLETFNLDEYVGLPATHPGSFRQFMQEYLFSPLHLPSERCHLLNGMAADLNQECAHYDELLERRGLDIQLLGIGTNGHIGYNEPGTAWESRTHRMRLSHDTIAQNRDQFPGDLPEEALTMGIWSILQAKAILVVAIGASKAEAVAKAICGPLDVNLPASALQNHPDVTYLLDAKAAERLLADQSANEDRMVIRRV